MIITFYVLTRNYFVDKGALLDQKTYQRFLTLMSSDTDAKCIKFSWNSD